MKSFNESKVASLLSTFDAERIARFVLFVHSPYFNSSETIRAVFDAMIEYHPDFDDEGCTLESLHTKAFGDRKTYDYHRINNVLSDIYELGLRFLVQISRDDQDVLEHWRVLPRLRQARLDKQFEQQLKRVERLLSENENDDFYHLYRNYYLNERIWFSSSHKPEERFGYLQEQYDSILNFILIRLGRLTSLLKFEEYQSSITFSLPLMEEILSFFQHGNVPQTPVVQIYRYALMLLNFHRDEDYFELRRLVEVHREFLTPSDVAFATQFLTHHVLFEMYEHDRSELFQHLVADHKRQFATDKFEVQVVVPFADFVFTVRVACIAHDTEWAHTFMQRYLTRVVPDEQENCRAFALACISRSDGDIRQALMHVSQVSFRMPILAIQVRDMTVMLQYESEEYEQCLYSLDSFRHYIKSLTALPPRYIEAHQDFIRLTKRLIAVRAQARSTKRRLDVQKLSSEIESLPYNTFNIRRWLKEQCDLIR